VKEKLISKIYKYRYFILFTSILLVYFFNMYIDVMEIDTAQYALISMEMSFTKSFIHIYQQGRDYLDKPPLLFWLSSLSFMMIGISNFAYKLPSVLIALLGIYSLYRFSLNYYSKEKSILAALILASSQALFLITNDIRTDTNLLGITVFSIWQISEFLKKANWKNLILASLGLGAAMMAKGPIALIVPAAAFGTDFILKRQWKNIFKPQWIIMLVIISITLIPMSYGLYTQFDLHPEKFVYGLQGPSGLRFFYWTQSFGRITGENYWDNDAGYFYFFHTILWDFQPWILMFIPAMFFKIRKLILIRFKSDSNLEFISFGGFVLVYFAFSLSNYKLPHYIFVLFPFTSIITADFIYQLKGKLMSRIAKVQFGIMHLFWVLIGISFILIFPPKNAILPAFLFLLFLTNWFIYLKLKGKVEQIFVPSIITALGFNLLMSLSFYPNLLSFQSTSQAGKMVIENKKDNFYHYNRSSYSLNFYAKRITPLVKLENLNKISRGSWIYTNHEGFTQLKEQNIKYRTIKVFPSFSVTQLNPEFLIKKTRPQSLKYEYLIEIQ